MSNMELSKTTDMPLAVKSLREDLNRLSEQFKFALPAHIPVERFVRVVMTAVQRNPKLLRCTRQSFFNACMSAANDGLLPDGREGAIVPYGEDEEGRGKSDVAQWMPMIGGLRKKVRNSGMLADWNVQVVQEGDEFDYALGDNPFIHHKPSPKGGRTRPVLFAYSIATYPDGTKSREVMNIDQIKDIQSKSKAKRGPWSDPISYPEMCRKTVARLHAKQLPQSTDLDRLLHRDDALYDFAGAKDTRTPTAQAPRPASVSAALDQFGAGFEREPAAQQVAASPDPSPGEGGGEQGASEPGAESPSENAPAAADQQPQQQAPIPAAAVLDAYARGQADKAKGHARKAVPPDYRDADKTALAAAWLKGWDGVAL